MTGFAGVDADVRDLLGREDGKRFETIFAASGTDDPREDPFIHAKRADERAARAVVLIAKHCADGFGGTDGTSGVASGGGRGVSGLGEPLGIGLKEGESDEAIGGSSAI